MNITTNCIEEISNSYNEIPYVFQADSRTYPGKNAALALLYGLNCAPMHNCRILELGCAQGANIISIAESFPNSQITGVDISQEQIEKGTNIINALGLKNIQLIAQDFQDINLKKGSFDYIIAHGIFSWVPDHLQGTILKKIKEYLSPNGLAHVSFNTMPGWSSRLCLKNHLSKLTQSCNSLKEKSEKAFEFLNALHSNSLLKKDRFQYFVGYDIQNILNQKKEYVVHEYLATCNNPLYYKEFEALSNSHQLQILGEVQLRRNILNQVHPDLLALFKNAGSSESDYNELFDFLTFRNFRNMLLCHDTVKLQDILPSAFTKLYYSSRVNCQETHIALDSHTENTFKDKSEFKTKNLIEKLVLKALEEAYPRTLSLQEILEYTVPILEQNNYTFNNESILEITGFLFYAYTKNYIHFWTHPVSTSLKERATDTPKTLSLNRFLVKNTPHSVINHYHEMIDITPDQKKLLGLLDGKQTLKAIQKSLNWTYQDVQNRLNELAKYVLLSQN